MPNVIPQIGTRGLYRLLEPFQAALQPGVAYSCVATRRLQDITAAGGDPQDQYYTPKGLTSERYQADLAANVCIVSLQSSAGHWVYVPSSFIDGAPDQGGIPYTTMALAISLSALPDSVDLSYLKTKLHDVVLDTLGVETTVRSVALSATTLLSQAEHNAIEAARQAKISNHSTDYAQRLVIEAQRDAAFQRIQLLEEFIRVNHSPT